MFVLSETCMAVLAFLGRHGTIAVALSIFVGLALPASPPSFKPLLGEAIFVLLVLAFLRVEPGGVAAHWRAARAGPARARGWMMLLLPAVARRRLHGHRPHRHRCRISISS